MSRLLALMLSLLSLVAVAQGTEGPAAAPEAPKAAESDTAEAKAAKELLQKYLTAVKAKKWADAKKLLHPKTLEAIAERKKRLGKEDHPLAGWYHEKVDYLMKDFKVGAAHDMPLGTITIETTEDVFQVEEKGMAEGEKATYLLGKKGGKFFVADKKNQETFSKDSVKLGYKGWFDPEPAKEAPPAE